MTSNPRGVITVRVRKVKKVPKEKYENKDWDAFYRSGQAFIPRGVLPHAASVVAAVGKFVKVRNLRVLDVGCGTCTISIAFKQAGAHVVGLDASPAAIDIAKTIIDEAVVGDALDMPQFEDDEFDVVISSGLLEHFEDDEIIKILREQQRVASKYVVSMVPNPEDIIYRMYKHYKQVNGTWEFGKERNIDVVELSAKAGMIPIYNDATNIEHTMVLLDEVANEINFPADEVKGLLEGIKMLDRPLIGYLKVVISDVNK